MQVAAKSYLATGVALVGAGAIAISPVVPQLPDVAVPNTSSAAVSLTAVPNPIDFYAAVLDRTADNAQAVIEAILADPAPILSQIVENQIANFELVVNAVRQAAEALGESLSQVPATLQTAFTALTEGDVETALNTLLGLPVDVATMPFLSLVTGVVPPVLGVFNNINNVIQEVGPAVIVGGLLITAGPVLSTLGAVNAVIGDVVGAALAGNLLEVAYALVNAPGTIFDGLVNGEYGPPLMGLIPPPGILTPEFGVIDFLQNLRVSIADALKPQAVNNIDNGDQAASAASVPQSVVTGTENITVGTGAGATGGDNGSAAGATGTEDNDVESDEDALKQVAEDDAAVGGGDDDAASNGRSGGKGSGLSEVKRAEPTSAAAERSVRGGDRVGAKAGAGAKAAAGKAGGDAGSNSSDSE